jgi:hypothetical protein
MLVLTLPLASCKSGPATEPSNGCEWVRPIYPSKDDSLTDGTARQILNHNETGKDICGWSKPHKEKK